MCFHSHTSGRTNELTASPKLTLHITFLHFYIFIKTLSLLNHVKCPDNVAGVRFFSIIILDNVSNRKKYSYFALTSAQNIFRKLISEMYCFVPSPLGDKTSQDISHTRVIL